MEEEKNKDGDLLTGNIFETFECSKVLINYKSWNISQGQFVFHFIW